MPIEEYPAVKTKIIENTGTDNTNLWERQGFRKFEVLDRVKDVVLIRGDIPNSCRMLVETTYELPKKDKAAQLGLVNRHGLITRIHYASPFKGHLFPGDVIIQVNGQAVVFEDKNVDEKTGGSQCKPVVKKKATATTPASKALPVNDFKTVVTKILTSKTDTKITITVARLKTRMSVIGPADSYTPTPGYTTECAILYQYKHLKLGLNLQQTGQKVVVNYTVPDSVSHVSLNIGETILTVEEKAVSTLDEVRGRILDACNTNGWVRLVVEFPSSDQQKNMVRAQLTQASRETERPPFAWCADVRKYCEEGLEALKNGKEPEPIWKENKDGDGKEAEKKKSARKAVKKEVDFRKMTDDVGIPSEWNSKLFVVLPPLKTKDSEMGSANSVMQKK